MTNLDLILKDVRLTELGKIKIGGLSENVRTSRGGKAWRAPEKHDHFTVTTMNRGPDIGGARGDLIEDAELMEQLKSNPALVNEKGELVRLPIFVLSDCIDDILQVNYVWYAGRKVGARTFIEGEGEDKRLMVEWFADSQTLKGLAVPKVTEWDDSFLELTNSASAKLFKKHGVFNCVVAANQARFGGVYKLRTTSGITLGQLYSGLVELSCRTKGILQGLPLSLFIRPVQVSPEGKSTTVYVVGVEMRGADLQEIMDRALVMAKFQLAHSAEIRQIQEAQRKMITLPGFESTSDADEINQEFSPETVENEPPEEPDAGWINTFEALAAGDAPQVEVPDEPEVEDVIDVAPPEEDAPADDLFGGEASLGKTDLGKFDAPDSSIPF